MVNDLIKVPQLNTTMREMAREMMKAGMIDEIMDESINSALDTEDMEEETEAEIDKACSSVVHFCSAAQATSLAKLRKESAVLSTMLEEEAGCCAGSDRSCGEYAGSAFGGAQIQGCAAASATAGGAGRGCGGRRYGSQAAGHQRLTCHPCAAERCMLLGRLCFRLESDCGPLRVSHLNRDLVSVSRRRISVDSCEPFQLCNN